MAQKPSIIVLVVLALLVTHSSGHHSNAQPRTLLFPPTSPTRIQFIGGIGIPVENLNYESITSGYVLKAEYFLPTEAHEWQKTYLRPQTIHRRSLNSSQLEMAEEQSQADRWHQHNGSKLFIVNVQSQQASDSSSPTSLYRWIIYQAIEQLLQRTDRPGRQCMLRCICEHAAVPLHIDSGILAEMLHIVLTPTSSSEPLARADYAIYYDAERLGRMTNGKLCAEVYNSCRQSPLDYISTVFDID